MEDRKKGDDAANSEVVSAAGMDLAGEINPEGLQLL